MIDPIEKIISQLNAREFRDCDISWLDNKLENYIELGAKTLGFNGLILPSQVGADKFLHLNEYTLSKYVERFTALLKYFKTFND